MPPNGARVSRKNGRGMRRRPPQPYIQYLKILLVYIFIIIMNFITKCRLEYIWPLVLFIQGVRDSYKLTGSCTLIYISICIILDWTVYKVCPDQFIFITATCWLFLNKFLEENTKISSSYTTKSDLVAAQNNTANSSNLNNTLQQYTSTNFPNHPNHHSNSLDNELTNTPQNNFNDYDDLDHFNKNFDSYDDIYNNIENSSNDTSNISSNTSSVLTSNLIAIIAIFIGYGFY